MANIFKKNLQKDSRGITRPTRKRIPVIDKGISKASKQGQEARRTHLEKLRNRNKPISRLNGVEKDESVKICIQRKLGGYGDILMSTPLIQAFKERYPNSEFTYATKPELFKVLEGNPYIDKLVDYTTIDPGNYHLFADITTTGLSYEKKTNPPKNRIDLFAEYVGIRLVNRKPFYLVTQKEKQWTKEICDKWFGPREQYKLLYLDVSSVDPRRSWAPENWVRFIGEMNHTRPDLRFVINDFNRRLGKAWAYKNCQDISSYDFRATAALVSESDIFIGPDSGMIHIAGALEKPIVGIFGSMPSASRINYYENATAIETTLACKGCYYAACPVNIQCTKEIAPHRVRDAVLAKLNEGFYFSEELKKLNIDIYSGMIDDAEVRRTIDHLKIGLESLGLTCNFQPQHSSDTSIVFDVIKTSLIHQSRMPIFPPGKLRIAYLLVEESSLSKDAINRISRGYDIIFTDSKEAMSVLSKCGLSLPIYHLPIPIWEGLHTSNPKGKIKIGVLTSKKEVKSNKAIYSQALEALNQECSVVWLDEEESYSSSFDEFCSDLNIMICTSSNISSLFVKEAMMRGIVLLCTDSLVSVKDIPDSLVYKVPAKREGLIYYEGPGVTLGAGIFPLIEDVSTSILDIYESYEDQVQVLPIARKWILEHSSIGQLKKAINLITQRL